MDTSQDKAAAIERGSLELGKWGNLLMAATGVAAAYFSRSDALLVDGLYSGVNFFSAIIAARVSSAVALRPDRRFPFGYAVYEALYVNFRSIVLLAIMALAAFGAIKKIVTYATGGAVPELVYGPIMIYTVVMVVMCAMLAAWHRYNWRRSGKRSELLTTESKAAVVDGVISGGAGGGLMAATLLRGTALDTIVPVADSLVVLLMTACIVRQPIQMFRGSLHEVAGGATQSDSVKELDSRIRALFDQHPCQLMELSVTKLGRTHLIVAYLNPKVPITGEEADEAQSVVESECRAVLGDAVTAVVITARPPYEH